MGILQRRRRAVGEHAETEAGVARAAGFGAGVLTGIASLAALLISLYNLWDTSLKQPELRVFVPQVIHYAAPYQNSNFEVIAVPVTITNDGARTGTVLSMELAVTDPRTSQTKLFYAADLGRWTMERARTSAFQPFAPLSMAGRTSRTETVLFYTLGSEQKPDQVIREPGTYAFKLRLEQAEVDDFGVLDRLWPSQPTTLVFERRLLHYDARAFNNGTLPMHAPDWKTAASGR